MPLGNFAFELAERRAEQEREASIARAHSAVTALGEIECVSCSEEIDPARRRAFPAARRCIECQTRIERKRRRMK